VEHHGENAPAFAVGCDLKMKKQLSIERMTRHTTETRPKKEVMQ